jgi:hypothetical protein
MTLTPEKAEIVGAMLGDKIRFGFFKRYGSWTRSKKPRGILEICLGSNGAWGKHLSDLTFRAYGLRGCTYGVKKIPPRKTEWRFTISSPRVVQDLLPYFDPVWRSRTWQVASAFFEAQNKIVEGLLRGYMDADGFVHTSNTRGVRVESVNKNGLLDIQVLFAKLGIESTIYPRRSRRAWTLQISRKYNVSSYRRLVGFSLNHKAQALNAICSIYEQCPRFKSLRARHHSTDSVYDF